MWSVGDAVVALVGVVIGTGETWIFLIFTGLATGGGKYDFHQSFVEK